MGLFDNIKTALGIDPDDMEGYDDDYEYSQPMQQMQPDNSYLQRSQPVDNNGNNRVNISVTAQLQVILVKPEKFSDTKEIANHLNNKKTVVLNLEATTPDVTRRIIDFLGGVAYANGGSIKPVANNTFIITPYNVGFQGDELSAELESNGVLL
ncbi:MAG: cell division protein SepF [Ruminococcus sp.]|nr:cell division protein SepF [Ruminococcus sp.]